MIALLALLLALNAPPGDDDLAARLEAWQPAQLNGSIRPSYVVHDRWPRSRKPRTIFAIVATDSEGARQLVAFRVGSNGSLRRLASYRDTDARKVEQRDVTGDDAAEVLLTSSPGNRSAPVEILRWDGRRFVSIGETNDQAEFIDLNGDGVPEIVERDLGSENSCGEKASRIYVKQLHGGVFDEMHAPMPACVVRYEKTTDETERTTVDWALPDSSSLQSRIRVFNGAHDSTRRAAAISIRLRDSGEVAGKTAGIAVPLDLDANHEYSEATVTLPSRCGRAWISVRGPAGSAVTWMLEADSAAPATASRRR